MPARAGSGRKPFVPTKVQCDLVRGLAASGIVQDAIARLVIDQRSGKPITVRTLQRKFRVELDLGTEIVIAELSNKLLKTAMGNGPHAFNALKFFLTARGGGRFKETNVFEHSGPGGLPLLPFNAAEFYGEPPPDPKLSVS